MLITKRRLLQSGMATTLIGWAKGRARADPAETTLTAKRATIQLTPTGPALATLAYGPDASFGIVRAKQGQDLTLRVRNELSEPTSFRICGLRGLGTIDEAIATIAPGADAVLRIKPAAPGTALMRPAFTSNGQAGRGLNGVLIVDPAVPDDADQDLVCVLEDWLLDATGQLAAGAAAPSGPTSTITATKKPIPADFTFPPGSRVHLRLVNASVRRVMVVGCEGVKPSVIAIDGLPSELFQPSQNAVPIGPGARFDWRIDLPRDAGQSVRLILRGNSRAGEPIEPDRLIWTLRTAGVPLAPKPAVAPPPASPGLPTRIPLEKAKRADLTVNKSGSIWTVNGVDGTALPRSPVLRVRQGDAVTLGLINASKDLVSLTLFGQALRLLHPLDDGWEPYWRDTVLLPPGSRNHVAFIAERPGRWPIEAGFQDQAVHGLRCWFEVARS